MKREHWPALAAGLSGVALYAITLGGTYIYDDVLIADLDPRLHHVHRWVEFLTSPYAKGSPDRLFRPLTSLSFAVEWFLHGDRPWVMHLVNVLLYGGVCALVAVLARRVGGVRLAWVAGVLFAVHPVHVEGVAYLVGRADLMATLGILGGLILFLHRPMTHGRAAAIWGCMVMAILAKEPGMLLAPILLAWVPWRRAHVLPGGGDALAPPGPDPAERRANQFLLLILCWTLAGYIVFREESGVFKFSWDPFFVDRTMNPLVDAGWVDRILVPFTLVGRYLQLLVCPWRLSIDYGGWVMRTPPLADPYFYVGVAAVVGWWVGLVVAVRRRAWAVVAAMVCLVVTYAMVSNMGVLIGAIFGERLIFLPSVFFVLLVAMALARIGKRVVLAGVVVVLVVLAAVRTETYAWRWNDAYRLYSMCAEEQPTSVRLWMLVLDWLERHGDLKGAARAGAAGRAAQPNYWRIWYFSAQVEGKLGHREEALDLIRHAETIPNNDPSALGRLRADINAGKLYPATTAPGTGPSATTEPR